MKRILKFGGALLALGMLLASCNMLTSDSTVSGNSTEQESSNINSVTIGVKSIDNNRTILPADWDEVSAGKLTYVLLGEKKDDESGYETKKTFSYSELTGGTATVNLEMTVWKLKLIGYITEGTGEEGYKTHPCLEKELTADLTTGTKTVTFDLKPAESTAATGSVNVTIAWLTNQPKRLEFGIYDPGKNTAAIVEDKGRGEAIDSVGTPSKKLNNILTAFSGTGDKHTANWSENDNIDAGMYKFAAVFYDAAADGNVIGYYIDYLYVDGGNLSKATVNYGNKFNSLPDNPTWLAVETVFAPQELPKDTTVSGEYYAKFYWNDMSNNETGFELVITDDTGKVSVVNPDEDEDQLISDKWYDKTNGLTTFDNPDTNPTSKNINTIDAGRTWVVLKLKTQTLYTAKIRAINNLTRPYYVKDAPTPTPDTTVEFCENLNRTGDGQGRIHAPIVGTGKQFGMFAVNYKLDNSIVITKADGTTTGDGATNYIVGFNYSDEEQKNLMTDDLNETPRMENENFIFDHWQITKEGGKKEAFPVIPALNIKNLELEPVWLGRTLRVSVTFPSYAKAQDVNIVKGKNDNIYTFKYDKDETNLDPKKNTITVSAAASITPADFELSAVDENGKIITSSDSDKYGSVSDDRATWEWKPTEKTPPGLYCLQITGSYKPGFDEPDKDRVLTLSGNLYIKVEN